MKHRPRRVDVTRLRMQVMGLARRLRHETQSNDHSWARMLVLGAIDRHGEAATPSTLAAAERMQSSNLATTLRELESIGLIIRTPDTEDKRKVRVRLTSPGKRLLFTNRARRERWLAQAMEVCLTEEELALLLDAGELLERIAKYEGSGAAENMPNKNGNSRIDKNV